MSLAKTLYRTTAAGGR